MEEKSTVMSKINNEEFRAMFEAMGDGVNFTDLEGYIREVNQAFLDLLKLKNRD